MTLKSPELLLPAGSLEKMRAAYDFGADAVYAGQPRYSLRARNNEFRLEQLAEGIAEAHRRGKRFFVTSNLIAHNELRFKRWFDLMGVQRHLKVLGIFCRLWYRDGKAQYLNDLPLVLKYTLEVATVNKDLKPFGEWLAKITANIDLTRPRD